MPGGRKHEQETNSADKFSVFGRGILHLSILAETMRREGYEFQMGQPQVITKNINGQIHEPFEELTVQVPERFSGKKALIELNRKVLADLAVNNPDAFKAIAEAVK